MTRSPRIYPRRASAWKGVWTGMWKGQHRTVGHSEPPTGLMEKNRTPPAVNTTGATNTRRST